MGYFQIGDIFLLAGRNFAKCESFCSVAANAFRRFSELFAIRQSREVCKPPIATRATFV